MRAWRYAARQRCWWCDLTARGLVVCCVLCVVWHVDRAVAVAVAVAVSVSLVRARGWRVW